MLEMESANVFWAFLPVGLSRLCRRLPRHSPHLAARYGRCVAPALVKRAPSTAALGGWIRHTVGRKDTGP